MCKGNNPNNFEQRYNMMLEKTDSYEGNRTFTEKDYLKIPEVSFKVKREYEELENQIFYTKNGDQAKIEKAIQSIQMKMDEKGGSVKSEAVMDVTLKAAMPSPNEEEARYFYFDDEYDIFLLEKGKEKPYFALHVSDITKFQ